MRTAVFALLLASLTLPAAAADAHWRLGELPQARDTLAALLAKHPDLKQARDLQARLTP